MFLPNHTQVPNDFVEKMMRNLNGSAVKVFIAICRKTIGWHKVSDAISYSQIEKLSGMRSEAVATSLRDLESTGLIKVVRRKGLPNLIDLSFDTSPETGEVAETTTPKTGEVTSPETGETKETVKQTRNTLSPSAPVASAPADSTPNPPVQKIIQHLNTLTGRNYRFNAGSASAKMAAARWRDGCWKLEDFFLVHEHKASTWLRDPKMADFVRPSTLYRPSHFEEYVLAARAWRNPQANVPRETDDERKLREYRHKMGLAS